MTSIHTCPQLSQALLGCLFHWDPFSDLVFHSQDGDLFAIPPSWSGLLPSVTALTITSLRSTYLLCPQPPSGWHHSHTGSTNSCSPPAPSVPHSLHHPLCHVYKTVHRLLQGFLPLSWQTPKDQASAVTCSRCASWVAHPLLHASPHRLASASRHRASWSHLVNPLVAAPAHLVLFLNTEGRCN